MDLRPWALKGAEQRLVEISEEAAAIYATFPELRDRANGDDTLGRRRRGRPRKGHGAAGSAAPVQRRKRTMSREARKRISEAQKARWAKQKGQVEAPAATQAAPAHKAARKSSRKKK